MDYCNTTTLYWVLYLSFLNVMVYRGGRKTGHPWLSVLIFNFQMLMMLLNGAFVVNYAVPFVKSLNPNDAGPWGLVAQHPIISTFLSALIVPLLTVLPVMVWYTRHMAYLIAQKKLENSDMDEKTHLTV